MFAYGRSLRRRAFQNRPSQFWLDRLTTPKRNPIVKGRSDVQAPLCRDDLPGSAPALPRPADAGQGDPALVRRYSGGLDNLHAVLPAASVRGLRLFALFGRTAPGPDAGPRARPPPRPQPAFSPRSSRRPLASRWDGKPRPPDHRPARGDDRIALSRPIDHEPPPSILVPAGAPRPLPIPSLRAVELRLPARLGGVSVRRGAASSPADSGAGFGPRSTSCSPRAWFGAAGRLPGSGRRSRPNPEAPGVRPILCRLRPGIGERPRSPTG